MSTSEGFMFGMTHYTEGCLFHGPRSEKIIDGVEPEGMITVDPNNKRKAIVRFEDKILERRLFGTLETHLSVMKKQSMDFCEDEMLPKNKKKNLPGLSQGIPSEEDFNGHIFAMRRLEYIHEIAFIGIDFDNEHADYTFSEDEILFMIETTGFSYLLYESVSSTEEKYKARAIFPLTYSLSDYSQFQRVYSSFVKRLIGEEQFFKDIVAKRPNQLVDVSCMDVTRVFFLTTGPKMARAKIKHGQLLDPKCFDEDTHYTKKKSTNTKKKGRSRTKSLKPVKEQFPDLRKYGYQTSVNFRKREQAFYRTKKEVEKHLKKKKLKSTPQRVYSRVLKKMMEMDISRSSHNSNSSRLKDLIIRAAEQDEVEWKASIDEFILCGLAGGEHFLKYMKRKIHTYSHHYEGAYEDEITAKIERSESFFRPLYNQYSLHERNEIKFKSNPNYAEPEVLTEDQIETYTLKAQEEIRAAVTQARLKGESVINSSDPCFGKTYNTTFADSKFLTSNPDETIVWFSSQYPALFEGKSCLLAHGVDENSIVFIPQPVSESVKEPQPYQFVCPHYKMLNNMRRKGISYTKHLCYKKGKCKMKDTCPLLTAKRRSEEANVSVVMAHSSYLKTDFPERFVSNSHMTIDEPKFEDLLRITTLNRASLLRFKKLLKNHLGPTNKTIQQDMNQFNKLISWCLRIGKSMEEEGLKTSPTIIPDSVNLKNDFDESGMLKDKIDRAVLLHLKGLSNIQDEYMISIYNQLLLLGKSQKAHFKRNDSKNFEVSFDNPFPLKNIKSLVLLDAAGNVKLDQFKVVLKKCGAPNLENLKVLDYRNHKSEKSIQILGSNYSRTFFKAERSKEISRLSHQITRLANKHRAKQVSIFTYKQNEEKLPGLTNLMSKLEEQMTLIQPAGAHFHGNYFGVDVFSDLTPEEKENTLLIILGAPRANQNAVYDLAFHLDQYIPNDPTPFFDRSNQHFILNGSTLVTNAFHHDENLRTIELSIIQEELIQALGRGSFRGVKTVILNNMPLPNSINATRTTAEKEVGRFRNSRENEKLILQRLYQSAKQTLPKLTLSIFTTFVEDQAQKTFSKRLLKEIYTLCRASAQLK